MKSLIDLNRITYISGMFGIACLLVGLISSFLTQTGEAVTVNSNCDTGYVEKDESKPFEYNGSETIVKAIVKAGQDCFPLKINSPNDGCYKANGLGTSSVKVSRIGEPSPSCQEISFVEFYAGQVETPETPTETPETPTETPETPTETPETPTETPATPVTPTATESKPPPIENPTPTSPSYTTCHIATSDSIPRLTSTSGIDPSNRFCTGFGSRRKCISSHPGIWSYRFRDRFLWNCHSSQREMIPE
jgi:hypothetical protein